MTLVHTDHQNLTYFQKAQKLSDRQARWLLFISEFDIKLQHLPGNKMVLSDALSRRPDHCPEEDKTKEEILLPDDLFLNLLDINLRDRIMKNKEYNFDITKAIELLQEALWDPWGLFFIHLTHESGISNYKGMNSGGMNLR
jgi:RNase H-like domain found in reverse transcriptase